MARTFNGSTQYVGLSVGNLAGMTFGTFAAVVKIGADSTWRTIVELKTSGDLNVFGFEFDDANLFHIQADAGTGGSFGTVPTVAEGWAFVAVAKPTGSSSLTYWKYIYSTGAWTTGTGGSAIANASGTITKAVIGGNYDLGFDYTSGDIAAVGVWKNTTLTDAQVRILASSYKSWIDATGFWILDQAATTTLVNDRAGTAHESGGTLPTISTTGPPIGYGASIRPQSEVAGSGTVSGSSAQTLANATSAATGTAYGIAYGRSLGTNVSISSGTTLVITTGATAIVGDWIVVRVAADNLNATTPTITAADSAGNTYATDVQGAVNATGAAGVAGAIISAPVTTQLTSGATITVTFSGAIAHKVAQADAYTGVGDRRGSGTNIATGASSTPSVALTTPNVYDLVVGAVAAETRTTPTAYDTDTSSGSWSAGTVLISASGGTDAGRVEIVTQHKVATATASQTYDLTIGASTEWVAMEAAYTAAGLGTVTGTAAVTLANATSSASGSEVTGSSAQTLANATSAASGTHAVSGTSARTLANFTSAAAGSSVTGTSARTLANATAVASGQVGTTTYILNDDFPGTSIDTGQWVVYNRLGDQGNSEVNAVIPANVRVSGGSLLIDSKFEDVVAGDTTTGAPNPRTVNYTSGQVAQKATPFLYGDVQVRAKIPGGTGLWPCIWMLGHRWQASQPFTANVAGADGPNDGWFEIDIAEFMLGHRTVVNNALHFITNNRGGSGEKALPYNATTRFMVYRLVWTPTSVTFMVDPEDGSGWNTTLTITGTAGTDIPNSPGYLIIHTAIGGAFGGTPDSATFPQTMEVDYARVAMTSDSVNNGAAAVTLAAATSAASGSTVTGTSARTLANATSAATGSAGGATGTVARTLANVTSAASGTAGGAAGSAAVTLANATAAASGTFTPATVTGTAAVTLANATAAATGAFGANPVGTVAVTLANATAAASGSSVAGSAAVTLANATSAASGAAGGATGTAALTLAPFTATASGSETLGTAGATLAPFTSTASGSTVTGTAARTLAAFTSVATGTAGQIYTITGRGDLARTTSRADGARTTKAVT